MSINTYRSYKVHINWYCRNCWNKGYIAISFTDVAKPPTEKEMIHAVKLVRKCCMNSDLRVVYDEKAIERN